MPHLSFRELMVEAERGQYAIGYFESWDMESLLAVADAAEATRSPVLLGFSGIYMHHPERVVEAPLNLCAALGRDLCERLSVPASLVFNESPYFDRALEAIDLGFDLVMFSDENLGFDEQVKMVHQISERAHQSFVSVEGEAAALPGVSGELSGLPDDKHLTDPTLARSFVERTGVDAFAVNIGQAHLHGRQKVRLDLARLVELKDSISVPLVLHGSSSVNREDLGEAIRLGIRKVNVGSVLKQSYFEALRRACSEVQDDFNPYEVIGSGLEGDVLATGRITLQKTVEDLMRLFGSAGQAK